MTDEVPFSTYANVNPPRQLQRGRTYPFVEMAAVPEGGGPVRYFQERTFDSGGTRFAVGDTLFARITPCTENGKVAKVTDLNGLQVSFGSTEFIVLSAKKGISDPNFLYQVVISDRVRRAAARSMLGSSGRQRVPNWFFEDELMLPRFTLLEQQAIAAILDSIDEAIQRTEEVIAAAEELRQALLQDLLCRGIPGWHTEWKQVPGLGTIPADWEVVRLGDCIEEGPTNGLYKPEDAYGSGTWLIRIDDFNFGRMIRTEGFDRVVATPAEETAYGVQHADILINRVNSLSHLGKAVLVPHLNELALFESNMMRLRTSERLHPAFLLGILLSTIARRQFLARAKKAVQQASINQQDVQELVLPLPPRAEQEMIVHLLESVRARESTEENLLWRASSYQAIPI